MSGTQIWFDTLSIVPEIIVAITAMIVLAWDFLRPREYHEIFGVVSLIGLLFAVLFTGSLWGQNISIFNYSMSIDNLSVGIKLVCLIISTMVVMVAIPYLKKAEIARGEFYALLLFATLGMMIVADGTSLIVIYLGLELLGISSYIMTAFMVKDNKAGEAAIKYFLLGSLASAILVYGMVLVYGMTGHVNVYAIQGYLINQGISHDPGLLAALILLIAGFGFKVGMVPFHMWLPDVYEGAPTPVSAFISTGSKVAPIVAIIRIFVIAISPLNKYWVDIFAIVAAITITSGNLMALRQENIKRMLAYSGITHIGYIMMGLVAAGISRSIGLTSVVFYFVVYLLANIGAFGVLIYLCKEGGRWGENLSDIKGLAKVSPLAALLMSIFVLSLLGIPPTGGFIGKFWVFAAAIKTNVVWLAIVGIINAVISSYYYLRVMVMMYMHEPAEDLRLTPSPTLAIALTLMAAITVYMGFNPGMFYDFAHNSLRLFL